MMILLPILVTNFIRARETSDDIDDLKSEIAKLRKEKNCLESRLEKVEHFLRTFNSEEGTTASRKGVSKRTCLPGYTKTNDFCYDDNECEDKNDCHPNAVCKNTDGGYECECGDIFKGDGRNCDPFTILALSSAINAGAKRGVVIDGDGATSPVNVEFGSSEADLSCSVTFQNQMLLFGGRVNKRQVARIDGCKLNQIGTLGFDFAYGACTATGEKLFLCFDLLNSKTCRSTNRITSVWSLAWMKDLILFDSIEQSLYEHERTRIASSDVNVLAIGSHKSHAKVELLGLSELKWRQTTDYPYSKVISYAPVVFSGHRFYVFGGHPVVSTIASFDEKYQVWSKSGELKIKRYGHGVVAINDYFMVVGGYGYKSTEKCKLSGGYIKCAETDQKLENFAVYPELFVVDPDRCTPSIINN